MGEVNAAWPLRCHYTGRVSLVLHPWFEIWTVPTPETEDWQGTSVTFHTGTPKMGCTFKILYKITSICASRVHKELKWTLCSDLDPEITHYVPCKNTQDSKEKNQKFHPQAFWIRYTDLTLYINSVLSGLARSIAIVNFYWKCWICLEGHIENSSQHWEQHRSSDGLPLLAEWLRKLWALTALPGGQGFWDATLRCQHNLTPACS